MKTGVKLKMYYGFNNVSFYYLFFLFCCCSCLFVFLLIFLAISAILVESRKDHGARSIEEHDFAVFF